MLISMVWRAPRSRVLALLGSAALISALQVAGPAAAQQAAQLSGLVHQAHGDAPLAGVLVRVEETGQTAVTDSEGRYRFGAVAPGTYTLTFRYLGLPEGREAVQAVAGENPPRLSTLGREEVAELLVTGQRGAQAKALSRQRAADNLKNVVSADQAGRFPDLNAAESLRRMPGVSVQREVVAGEGRYVSIRGLDSGLNNTQINGMNAAQPEKESRRVPLDMVHTSTLSSITVHKTLLPDQDADGIGGAVVLETATAFDFAGPAAGAGGDVLRRRRQPAHAERPHLEAPGRRGRLGLGGANLEPSRLELRLSGVRLPALRYIKEPFGVRRDHLGARKFSASRS